MSHSMKIICLLAPIVLAGCGESESTNATTATELVASAQHQDVKVAIHAESLSAETLQSDPLPRLETFSLRTR